MLDHWELWESLFLKGHRLPRGPSAAGSSLCHKAREDALLTFLSCQITRWDGVGFAGSIRGRYVIGVLSARMLLAVNV